MASTNNGALTILPQHAWCRGLTGHRWTPPSSIVMEKGGVVVLRLVCMNCHTVRTDYIDSGNGLLTANGRGYEYATGYVTKAGRQKPGALRKIALATVIAAKRVKVIATTTATKES